jgi:hypothetical protein
MAGLALQAQGSASRRAPRAVSLIVAVALLALLLVAGRSAAPTPAAAALTCPALPSGLSPTGSGPTRFTMMIRINQQVNVDTWTNFNESTGGLGDRIHAQDIFVINTRFQGSTPSAAAQLANELRGTFPCNRIIALNGMSFTSTGAGYAFSLIDNPNVYALITDFEKGDWDAGRASDPTRPAWVNHFKRAFPVIRGWNASVAGAAASNPAFAGKRTGLAPLGFRDWNYGQIAQNLDKLNARLGESHLGPQSVQTQDACADGGPSGFGAQAKQLRIQYTFKFITKKVKVRGKKGKKKTKKITIRRPFHQNGKPSMSNLAMEISFTDNPNATESMAILSTSAARAASCVPAGLKQGGGAFFFFASDDAMRLLFQQPQIAALRPPGASSSGATGGVHP